MWMKVERHKAAVNDEDKDGKQPGWMQTGGSVYAHGVKFVTYRIALKVFTRGMFSKQLFFVLPYRQRAPEEVPLGCRLLLGGLSSEW